MSLQSDPPQLSMDLQAVRPRPVVSRRPAAASRAEETSPAPLGFEALLKEINTVVELLERIDVALDQQVANSPAAVMADDAPAQHPNLQN